MKRPNPTSKLVTQICGAEESQGLIASLHHGLYEASLGDVFHVLNLDEVVAFSAGHHQQRKSKDFRNEISQQDNAYDLFNLVYSNSIDPCQFEVGIRYENPFSWLNSKKSVYSENEIKKQKKLNPFDGKTLKERLESLPESSVEKLQDRLKEPVNEYVFECNYHKRKRERGGDNHRLVIMTFQNVYPRKGTIVPAYSREISRMIKKYPSEYELSSQKEKIEPKTDDNGQFLLV